MKTREEFGSYILLKKLAEDPLGETFRAGRLGSEGMEQVVLLRAFNADGIDHEKLWGVLQQGRDVQRALTGPNVGNGVDLDQADGVPYVAYDYISGTNLATLLLQSSREGSAIPTDHALLIAERVAMGLVAGFETRAGDSRVMHGFTVPQLVMLSNEGEIRLLGFESAPALRATLGQGGPPELQRYLSPEARAGQPVSKTDDVYSLGVILFELLTGRPAQGSLEGATLAAEGTPIPPELLNLLKQSLGPKDQRISDVAAWHKQLARLMTEGQYNPTTFNLAFFMHNLFRDQIERESKEIEAEKTMVMPSGEGAATTAIPMDQLRQQSAEPPEESTSTEVLRERYQIEEEEKKGGGKGLLIAIAAVVVLGLIGAGVYFTMMRGGGDPEPQAEPITIPEPVPEQDPSLAEGAEVEEGPSEEELIREQIDSMLEERTAEMQENIQAQYDERLKQLQAQLEEARDRADDEAQKREEAAAAAAQPEPAEPEPTEPAAEPAGTPQEEVAAGGAGGAATGGPQDGASGAQGGAAQGGASQQTSTAPAEPEPAEPEPEPEPVKPRVRVGDLVTPGPGVEPPKLTRRPEARFPPMARRLNKTATISVRVLVSETGRVDDAQLAGDKVGFGFDEAALTASRAARFDPATKDGVRVKMWYLLNIEFK